MKNNDYSISQISKITGVSTSAINYYIRLNILESPKKTSKTRALFTDFHIKKISEIKELQNSGFPLKLIKKKINSIASEIKEIYSVEEIINLSKVSRLFYDDLLENNLLDHPVEIDNKKVHPNSTIKIISSYKTLIDLGVSFETLKRHEDYKKLSEAEAYFLLEHLNDAKKNKSDLNNFEIITAFETIRNFYRMDFFNE
ncbi:MAG: helix-turn-helix domain-containing protein [Dehalococcoidia bacterium]|nr:helix-turn-helix domain-containing protein [Dehalococcoidia bacterium]